MSNLQYGDHDDHNYGDLDWGDHGDHGRNVYKSFLTVIQIYEEIFFNSYSYLSKLGCTGQYKALLGCTGV